MLGVLLDYLSTSSVTFLPLLRIFRVVRIFKLIPKARGLRALLQTLVWCVWYSLRMRMYVLGTCSVQEQVRCHIP